MKFENKRIKDDPVWKLEDFFVVIILLSWSTYPDIGASTQRESKITNGIFCTAQNSTVDPKLSVDSAMAICCRHN